MWGIYASRYLQKEQNSSVGLPLYALTCPSGNRPGKQVRDCNSMGYVIVICGMAGRVGGMQQEW